MGRRKELYEILPRELIEMYKNEVLEQKRLQDRGVWNGMHNAYVKAIEDELHKRLCNHFINACWRAAKEVTDMGEITNGTNE